MSKFFRKLGLRKRRDDKGDRAVRQITAEFDSLRLLIGRSLAVRLPDKTDRSGLGDVEFSVFSQFGDDGIIQYLVRAIPGLPERFIEFGVESYREANTRFLLLNNNWKGLILDGSAEYMARVRNEALYWRHDLTAIDAFVTRENVNALFESAGFTGEIGLLSIDIDGNDYWIWEAINVVYPVIVIVEYNSVFGPQHAVTIPYQSDFDRTRAHYSNLYWGCSIAALCHLAERKGFSFIGCNTAGNNAYFVRDDRLGSLTGLSAAQGYVESKFRESRDASGALTFISAEDRINLISDLPVFDLNRDGLVQLEQLLSR